MSTILYHLNELRDEWRRQDFFFTKEQREKYNILLAARRERVKELYREGRVYKGSKSTDT